MQALIFPSTNHLSGGPRFAKIRGYLPEHLHLIGIQPLDISIGLGLSPEIEQALLKCLEKAGAILDKWNSN